MKVRDILNAFAVGRLTVDEAEHQILYGCDDVTYLEEDDEDDEDEEPFVRPIVQPTVESIQVAVEALPPETKQKVIAEMRRIHEELKAEGR